jgi:hypothetical protein
LKAAEDAPLGVLLLAEVCQEFLPPGVLNLLPGTHLTTVTVSCASTAARSTTNPTTPRLGSPNYMALPMVQTHQPGKAVFRSILPKDIDWKRIRISVPNKRPPTTLATMIIGGKPMRAAPSLPESLRPGGARS